MGIEKTDHARDIYSKINTIQTPAGIRAESEWIANQNPYLFSKAIKAEPNNPELLFLNALALYWRGHVAESLSSLKSALELNFDWEDDTPIDFVVQHVLATFEFLDFELLYLDAEEIILEHKSNPQNRWFSLNMPIFELYQAQSRDIQAKKAVRLAQMLDNSESRDILRQGRNILEYSIKDLGKSQTDARFGLEAMKKFQEGDFRGIAKMILGLQLEHLRQFSSTIGLTTEKIIESQLQKLIPLLPFRIALSVLFLYTTAGEDHADENIRQQNVSSDITAGIMGLAFNTFYGEIHKYQHRNGQTECKHHE